MICFDVFCVPVDAQGHLFSMIRLLRMLANGAPTFMLHYVFDLSDLIFHYTYLSVLLYINITVLIIIRFLMALSANTLSDKL